MTDITQPGRDLPEIPHYAELARQLIKDFGSLGVRIDFPESPEGDPDECIYSLLKPVVKELVNTDRNLLMKIVYRIDIPENRLGHILSGLGPEEAAEGLTREFIRREKQKVEIRRFLS